MYWSWLLEKDQEVNAKTKTRSLVFHQAVTKDLREEKHWPGEEDLGIHFWYLDRHAIPRLIFALLSLGLESTAIQDLEVKFLVSFSFLGTYL